MNKKLNRLANQFQVIGLILALWAAMRADGGLALWLPLVTAGAALCLGGLCLAWLCSEEGRAWRKTHFGRTASVLPPQAPRLLVFPKAG